MNDERCLLSVLSSSLLVLIGCNVVVVLIDEIGFGVAVGLGGAIQTRHWIVSQPPSCEITISISRHVTHRRACRS